MAKKQIDWKNALVEALLRHENEGEVKSLVFCSIIYVVCLVVDVMYGLGWLQYHFQ